jgi:hypothetical protein
MPKGIGLRVSPPKMSPDTQADGEDGLCDFDKLSHEQVCYLRSGNRFLIYKADYMGT